MHACSYEAVQPMVYCGLFPTDSDDYQDMREALEKLQLNDAALRFEPEVNNAMGFGFRCVRMRVRACALCARACACAAPLLEGLADCLYPMPTAARRPCTQRNL